MKLNQTGKANLLRQVSRPLGGAVTLDYKREGNHVDLSDPEARIDMPRNQWVLASATADDGAGNTYTGTFDYFGSGFYDRVEREDLGYAQVRTTREDGSTVDEIFHNQDYYRRQLLRRRIERAADGSLFRVTEVDYDAPGSAAVPITGIHFPAERERRSFFYEGTTTDVTAAGKSTRERRDWDDLGNLTAYVDRGSRTLRRHLVRGRVLRRSGGLSCCAEFGGGARSDNRLLRERTAQFFATARSGAREHAHRWPRSRDRRGADRRSQRQPHLAVRL